MSFVAAETATQTNSRATPYTGKTAEPEETNVNPYIVSFKTHLPDDKKPGAVKQYRIFANNIQEARHLVTQQANYPNLEIVRIQRA